MGCDDCNEYDRRGDRIIVSAWGGSDVTRQVQVPARFMAIGPTSEVDSVLVDMPMGPMVLSVESPLIDLEITRDTVIRPHATAALTTAQLGDFTQRLEIITLPYVPRSAWPTRRPPREYGPTVHTSVDATPRIIGAYPCRGAASVSIRLAAGPQDVSWRAAHVNLAFLASGGLGYEDAWNEYPVDPVGYSWVTPNYNTLPSNSNQSYHLVTSTDAADVVVVYALCAITAMVGISATVRD